MKFHFFIFFKGTDKFFFSGGCFRPLGASAILTAWSFLIAIEYKEVTKTGVFDRLAACDNDRAVTLTTFAVISGHE
jgi:hypothetical protein